MDLKLTSITLFQSKQTYSVVLDVDSVVEIVPLRVVFDWSAYPSRASLLSQSYHERGGSNFTFDCAANPLALVEPTEERSMILVRSPFTIHYVFPSEKHHHKSDPWREIYFLIKRRINQSIHTFHLLRFLYSCRGRIESSYLSELD